MKIILLQTVDEQTQGVLPYQPLGLNAIFFFKKIQNNLVSGAAVNQPIKVYALTRELKPISVRKWPWIEGRPERGVNEYVHVLNPESQAMLPFNTEHVVETAEAAPTITNFHFLKKYV